MAYTCPDLQRVPLEWEPLIEYFLKFIPKKNKRPMNWNLYLLIAKLWESPTMKAELQFVLDSDDYFAEFTEKFHH